MSRSDDVVAAMTFARRGELNESESSAVIRSGLSVTIFLVSTYVLALTAPADSSPRPAASLESGVANAAETALSVSPDRGIRAGLAVGRDLSRSFVTYRLANLADEGAEGIDWVAGSDDAWIQVGASSPAGGRLEPGQRAFVVVRLDPTRLPPLPDSANAETVVGLVRFEDRTHGVPINRTIEVELVEPMITASMISIPSDVAQPNGPGYSFEIGRYPVTNREFASFLNDAIYNTDSDRGSAMYFDVDRGDVYMHTSSIGAAGHGPDGHTIRLFSIEDAPGIAFADVEYTLRTTPIDYSEHPVTGVSWYGAVKFCNWMTIDQGLGADERCYAEGTASALSDWRPVSMDAVTWRSRDLTDAEALRFVRGCRGFRLPMDDGFANSDPTIDAADAYNEWFKAAAWSAALGRNSAYGFGRDTLASADANYRCSGDPFEAAGQCQSGGTTPVGFFDGVAKDVAGVLFTPNADGNGFGLFDMTGNVHQWMQGRYAPSTALDQRTLRGGSWNDPATAASLKNAGRTVWATPNVAHREIGFRVVRSKAASGDFNADGVVDLDDVPELGTCLTGPAATILSGCDTADLDEDGDVDCADVFRALATFGEAE